MPFLRTLPAIALLIFAIAAASYCGGEKAFSPSAGQDRLSKEVTAPLVDHHQHLLSPAGAELVNALGRKEKPVTGEQLVGMLDVAGIQRAVVLSDAYYFDSPRNAEAVRDGYTKVRAENDWTAQEVARFPKRLIGFCSFNPLREYALAELERCAKRSIFKGLKLHFGGSAVDLKNPKHVETVRRVFEAANSYRLPIIVHVRADETYGREHAEVLLNQLLPAAPNIPVQVAHLWGGEGFSVDALVAFADAVSTHHPATRNLYFDVAELALVVGGQRETLQRIATLIRQIGVDRILYGSDGPVFGNWPPAEAWAAFRKEAPLTDREFRTITNNIAPYLR
jgi:uncharacterized protein